MPPAPMKARISYTPRRAPGSSLTRAYPKPPRADFVAEGRLALEAVPEELVRDLVVVLHLRGLDQRAQRLGAALRGRDRQLRVLVPHLLAQEVGREPAALEEPDGVVDVVGQEPRARLAVLGLVPERPF